MEMHPTLGPELLPVRQLDRRAPHRSRAILCAPAGASDRIPRFYGRTRPPVVLQEIGTIDFDGPFFAHTSRTGSPRNSRGLDVDVRVWVGPFDSLNDADDRARVLHVIHRNGMMSKRGDGACD
jgi:hypothetical protein